MPSSRVTADRAVRAVGQAAARGVRPMEPVRLSMDMLGRTGGMVATDTTPQSRYVDLLYQQADAINRAFATYHDLLARGRLDEAAAFFAANKDRIARHGRVTKVEQTEALANRQIKRIGDDPGMGADQKRAAIIRDDALRNRVAESIFGARP